jgi:hypothetical protein
MLQFFLKSLNFSGHFVVHSAVFCSYNDGNYNCLIPLACCVKLYHRYGPISHIFKKYFIISKLKMAFVETSVI